MAGDNSLYCQDISMWFSQTTFETYQLIVFGMANHEASMVTHSKCHLMDTASHDQHTRGYPKQVSFIGMANHEASMVTHSKCHLMDTASHDQHTRGYPQQVSFMGMANHDHHTRDYPKQVPPFEALYCYRDGHGRPLKA
ncbi:uncharacterized protein [Musca autumnalis]|uniref:uncharacterized protein n=1 Tax=Musca autumnalis TaxID=221902 RepID=UPI003CF05DDA